MEKHNYNYKWVEIAQSSQCTTPTRALDVEVGVCILEDGVMVFVPNARLSEEDDGSWSILSGSSVQIGALVHSAVRL
jgi:hypothetical protein